MFGRLFSWLGCTMWRLIAAPVQSLWRSFCDWWYVTVNIFGLLRRTCGVHLYLLTVLVPASALLQYLQWYLFGGLLDRIRETDQGSAAYWMAIAFVITLALVRLIALATQKLTDMVSTHAREFLLPYFPIIRERFGMASFQRGSQSFNMLSRAEKAEYDIRFFLPAQITLIGSLLSGIVGMAFVSYHAPVLGVLLSVAMLGALYVQVGCAVRLSLAERKMWALVAEATDTQRAFLYKERLKGSLLFGISAALIGHLRLLGRRVFGELRVQHLKPLPWEVLSIMAVVAVYGFAVWRLLGDTVAGVRSIGEFSFLVTTLVSLGLTLTRIVEGLGKQALGADKIVDLFRYLNGEDSVALPQLQKKDALLFEQAPAVLVRNLSFEYEQGKPVLEQVSMDFPAGRMTFVVGSNGAGKTTLFNLLSSLYPLPIEAIWVGRTDAALVDPVALQRVIRHLSQDTLSFRVSIRQSLAFIAGYGDNPEECAEDIMWQALELACLKQRVQRFKRGLDEPLAIWNDAVEDLSGGQQRKLNIAMFFMAVLTGSARVLVLDEPFVGVDPRSAKEILHNLRGIDATIILSTHSVERIPSEANVIFMHRDEDTSNSKTVVFQGTQRQLLRDCPEYRSYCAVFSEEEQSVRLAV